MPELETQTKNETRQSSSNSPSIDVVDLLAKTPVFTVLAWSTLGVLLASCYASPLFSLSRRWMNEPDYSHGFFVPIFAAYLLWRRRRLLKAPLFDTGSWLGLLFLAIGVSIRVAGALNGQPLLAALSIVPVLAGIVFSLGGTRLIRWAWPSIVFLIFMIPLPGFLADQLHHPLQRIATIGGVYVLQTVGVAAIGQGNVIVLPQGELGIAEACAGLRMLNLFLAFCVGASFLIDRPFWEKALIIASAGLVGIAANVVRIVATGLVFEFVDPELATKAFHDFAGLILMPLAILFVSLEVYVLGKVLVLAPERSPASI